MHKKKGVKYTTPSPIKNQWDGILSHTQNRSYIIKIMMYKKKKTPKGMIATSYENLDYIESNFRTSKYENETVFVYGRVRHHVRFGYN